MISSNEYGTCADLITLAQPPSSPFQEAEERDRKGDLKGAAELYRQLVKTYPEQAIAHHNFAIILRKLERQEEALQQAKSAYSLSPDHPTIALSLGLSLENAGYLSDAEKLYRQALKLKPRYPAALNNLGRLLESQCQPVSALEYLDKAFALAPQDQDIRLNLANTLLSLGRPNDAHLVLSDSANSAIASNALGIALYLQRDWHGASEHFRHAVTLSPNFSGAHENLALALLHEQKFDEGWKEYDWRWKNPENHLSPRKLKMPPWDGSPLQNRHLLLHAEQGFGDTIQFVRFGSLIKKKGGCITLAAQNELLSLFSWLPWADKIVSLDSYLPAADVHAPLGSLPALLDPNGEQVRMVVAYLLNHELQRETLDRDREFRIGLCWAGRERNTHDPYRNRSCPVEVFQAINRIDGLRAISFLTGPASDAGVQLFEQPERKLESFLHTAREIMKVDLIITVDTAIAHLCGALGKPGIVILNYTADWRWGDGNGTAPWYPSLEMVRQKTPGAWSSVFENVISIIENKVRENQK